jgi:predicted RNA-binding protein YlxR (DUF448 family)
VPKKKNLPRRKHIPQRTCVGCREVLAKRSLTRVVRTPQGIKIDPSGKISGRGAYVHNQRFCWERAMKGALAQALRVEFSKEDKERLNTFISTLPEGNPEIRGRDDGE